MARRSAGRTIDFKEWTATQALTFESAAETTFQGGSVQFLQAATILRCRGFVQAQLDETQQAGDRLDVTFGLGVFSTDASVAGAGSLADPSGDFGYPWLWWGQMHLEALVAAGQEAWGTCAQRLDVDTKAMRRIKPSQTLAWVVQTTGAAGAPNCIFTLGQTRVLVGT